MVKVAVDAMGGDFAPTAVIQGVRLFLEEDTNSELILLGKQDEIERELKLNSLMNHPRISIVHTEAVIEMGDSPVKALRNKKNASLSVMMDLAKEGKADAVMSAGNTGAMVAAATLKLRPLEGIDKPGIATVIPTPFGRIILTDVGAVADCKPKNLVQFAVMASCLYEAMFGIANPSVGLLNVGEEDSKGNDLAKETFAELKKTNLNFKGNVEGRDVFKDTVHVIVTDGFVGNIVLKSMESMAKGLFAVVKSEITSTLLGNLAGLLLKSTFKRIFKRFNHEEYGGASLMGVNGSVVIAHGSSSALAIKNAIKHAVKMVDSKINLEIIQRMKNLNG